MSEKLPLYGCIEAGGTKFVLGVGTGPDDMRETSRIPTGTDPEATLCAVEDWFRERGPLAAIGIASFGPLDADIASPRWGYLTETVKTGWIQVDFAQRMRRTFGCPVAFDTDVNGAALGEARWGAGKSDRTTIYITVGTGIGGGLVVDGRPVHGVGHPEMGHIVVRRHPDDTAFPGVCAAHGDCLEGLASGPAILKRWGATLSDLPQDHPAHDIVASYLGRLAVTLQAILAPQRVIFGGGVLGTPGLLDRIARSARDQGGSWFQPHVVPPGLGERSGLLGALALAMDVAGAG